MNEYNRRDVQWTHSLVKYTQRDFIDERNPQDILLPPFKTLRHKKDKVAHKTPQQEEVK
jgi:pyoverdine/dityrosine biosynthesis protein Dit1